MNLLRKSLLIFVCFLCNIALSQQVTINDTFSAQQLIENNLIEGCVETSNITSQINGSVNGFSSFGYFEKGASNFPFENGIILSTGRAVSGGNTQNTAVLNEGESNWLTDPDLEAVLGISNTLNATSIEFDFLSISNQIQFNYILASEEYFGDFPCNYSDGFAFLIKKNGSNAPYTNIAVIPGTSTPVNTTTVHDEIVGFCPASNAQYFDGYNFPDSNFNGRTKILSATANINPNESYHIKLIIADQSDKNYDSAVFIEGNSFNATVDLGEDITSCSNSVTLDGNIENPQASYNWYLNSGLIAGAVQPTLTVNQSGSYTVRVDIPLGGSTCMIEDTVNVSVNATQTANPIPDYLLCDDPSMDGVESFDLSTQEDEVLTLVPPSNYRISYHFSSSDAQNNVSPITSPIQNSTNNQIIYVRIEDLINGCLAFSNFHLVVNPIPNITTPSILVACDDITPDGFTEINLTEKNDEITNGQPYLFVTYHYTQQDADAGINPIPQPYVNISPSDQLFVRVINSQTGCINTTKLTINVIDSPAINYEDLYIDACDMDHNGLATFDLTSVTANVLNGLTGVTVTFHESLEDAESGANPIANPSNYANTVLNEQIIYIRVKDNSSGCAAITDLGIHTNLLLTGTGIRDFGACDVDDDNVEDFSINYLSNEIINNLENVTVTFYETESDRDNQINALNPNGSFEVTVSPTLLYIRLNSLNCSDVAEIKLRIIPIVKFESVGSITYCNNDTDITTPIDLHSLDAQVSRGQAGFYVTYFATLEDAQTNNNPLPDFYAVVSNPQTLYPLISSIETGCGDIESFELTVLAGPETFKPDNILVCDDDQDGFSVVDLTQVYNQLVTDMTNRSISFYFTDDNLINDTNAFMDVSNYNTNSIIVYTKVTNTLTGCWSREFFYVLVSTLPDFPTIGNYKICENSSDDIGDFIFATKDEEILNGQENKLVSYFKNQADADNRINEIDKNAAFQNFSNPQTIYVRVESIYDQTCYGTSSFTIEVGTNPMYNKPSNLYACDDISNDAREVFDLSTKVTEITQGINEALDVTFFTSSGDAETGTNPLPLQFTNTFNPQQIYVRVDNGTICASFTSFTLNVIQAAQANPPPPLELCDTDYDGITTFDLTLSEIEILDVRQNNITISYFRTMEELDNQSNPIINPSDFTNVSNPQTVFVRLTNSISNCYLALPLELIVILPPAINTFGNVIICNDGTNLYDLSLVNNVIVNDASTVNISYYATQLDAQTNSSPLDTNYTYSSTDSTIYARVENATTGCFIVYPFDLNVKPLPIANTPTDVVACDDDFDGLLQVDLSNQNASILGGQNSASFSVTYYNSSDDVESGTNVIPDLYTAFDTEMIYARVQDNSTGCYNTTQFSVLINPKPLVDIPDQVICLENLPLLVSANTNNPTDTYLWSTNETTPEITISDIGSYSVIVTNEFGCETTQVFNVTESEMATIDMVETVDFSEPNNITVTISGMGNYLYQLDHGVSQESNFFDHVGLGYHTVTIIDLNGCAEVTKEVLVLDFPKFLTPNDDGYFDTWHIIGVETLPGTIIYIYDRFGKMLTYLTANSRGWDGTFNNQNMPATDYWFVANVKGGGYNFQAKGHFALKR
ncbi:MAG: choice-of-anchor L domain-containing protein [Aquaticitalea sp.]